MSVPVVLSVPPMTRSSARLATGRLSPVIMLSSTPERAVDDDAVDRDRLARPDADEVADADLRDRDVDLDAVPEDARGPRARGR